MKVRLIGCTQPTEDFAQECNTSDIKELIAYCARVSNPSNQMNHETSDRLLNYLKKHAHWSPFEMASATMEIETTRDIARQILRHRSFAFQEFSQRYADPTGDLGFVTRDARLQDPNNRQNSIKLCDEDYNHRRLNEDFRMKQMKLLRDVKEVYKWAIDNGIAKEQARAILPEGLTVSRMYMQGTIRSWIHFIELRSGNGTQQECQDVAVACAEAISSIYSLE